MGENLRAFKLVGEIMIDWVMLLSFIEFVILWIVSLRKGEKNWSFLVLKGEEGEI